MYSLDINLLSERAEYQLSKDATFSDTATIATNSYGKIPLYIGAGVAALSLALVGGGWLWTNQQTAQLEAKQRELDTKLGSLKVQEQRLQQLNTQVAQVTGESQALASVFSQVQPWSAVLQDLRDNTPQGIQIDAISQSVVQATAPAAATTATAPAQGGLINKISTPPNPEAKPAASPTPTAVAAAPAGASTAAAPADVPTTKIEITGKAKSFDDVNNFILTLKQAAFFDPNDTQLLNATLSAPASLETIGKGEPQSKNTKLELPKVVDYKIQTTLRRIPATELIGELERKGAVGLVTRLRTLQQQVIKP